MHPNEKLAIEKHLQQLHACLLPKINEALVHFRLNGCITPETGLEIRSKSPAEKPLQLLDIIMLVDSGWVVLNSFLCTNGHEDLSKNLQTTAGYDLSSEPNGKLCNVSAYPNAHAALSKPWNAPLRLPRFVGRENYLQQLDTLQNASFEPHERSSPSTKMLAVCVGLGGVGKSSIALEFIYRNMEKYDQVLWITATTSEAIEACYIQLGAQLRLPNAGCRTQLWEETLLWLSHNSGWLLVLDDVPCYLIVQSYIPRTGGRVLITSRHIDWLCPIITVTPFIEGETAKYLELVLPSGIVATEMSAFADALGNLPLAVAQATAYMLKHKSGLEEYLAKLKTAEHDHQLSNILPSSCGSAPVYLTWNVSIEKAKKECSFSVDLLEFCSFLNGSYVPETLLCEFAKQRRSNSELEIAKSTLLSYSLISITSNFRKGLSMHPLVQVVTKSNVTSAAFNMYIKDLCNCIENVWPNDPERNHDAVRDMYPTIEKCMHYILLEGEVTDECSYKLTVNVQLPTLFIAGEAYRILGYISLRHVLYKRMKQSAKINGVRDIDKLQHVQIWTSLGSTYGEMGDYRKQQKMLENILPLAEQVYGPNNIAVALVLNNLGNAYGDLGDHQKEKELLERALRIKEKHYGPDHPEVAITLNKLGVAYGSLGDHQRKKELLERALLIIEVHYGPNHRDVAFTLDSLGNAHGSLGDYQQKKELLERALLIKVQHCGPDHKDVAFTLHCLGNAHGSFGDYKKAKELLERALLIKEKHYGHDHRDVAFTLDSLGNVHGSLGDYQKQKELLERALRIKEKYYGPNHKNVAVTLDRLGSAYSSFSDYKKARELIERALLIKEKQYGPDHRDVAFTLDRLGNAYGSLGDHHTQKDLLERALRIKGKHYGPDHKNVAVTLTNLGSAYGSLGNYKKQMRVLERALLINEKHYGLDHKNVAFTLDILGNAYGRIGHHQKQKELLERALFIKEKHYGPEHRDVAFTLACLGNAYDSLGDYKKQKELLERALLINEKQYGSDHRNVAITLTNLGRAYGNLGNYQKQKKCWNERFSSMKSITGLNTTET